MKYFTPQNLIIAGAIYWFLFRNKVSNDFTRSGGIPIGEGYP
tara:strand:- start:553 stop:678 length:126 start_codon:yes stop_codon:yes gene_type:complete